MPFSSTTFGSTELAVSRLGFGASPIGAFETPRNQVGRLLDLLLGRGVNVIDTARCYGSEALLGELLEPRRDDVVLITKAGYDEQAGTHTFTADGIAASLDRSLAELRTDHVDVLLLHSCDLDVLEDGEAVEALVAAQKAGKARFIGYSGDNDEAAWAARDPRIQVLEMSINICDQANEERALPLCREHDKAVIAKRPLANAAWKNLDDQPGFYRDYAAEYTRRFRLMVQQGLTPDALGYSGHADIEWPEIALKYPLSLPGVHVAICGTTSTVHAEINLDAAGKNDLRDEVMRRIAEAYAAARDADGGDWPAQR